ncbi:hypothetical protein BKA65DRAFT_143808 [Rhexocercosporidium sp. MPI-PUGE-AT-0058]|nr:hypothetical protein BKA65DRAFT_143808 [Rhexocercosporidium sp. MPI-PUGE-AT-0058]
MQMFGNSPQFGYWLGLIAAYHDFYTATIWNTYRKVRLLVISIIMNCHNRICTFLENENVDLAIFTEIKELTNRITSSIQFVLSLDLQALLDKSKTNTPLVLGRPIGGYFACIRCM